MSVAQSGTRVYREHSLRRRACCRALVALRRMRFLVAWSYKACVSRRVARGVDSMAASGKWWQRLSMRTANHVADAMSCRAYVP
jgi:hypothetical protein